MRTYRSRSVVKTVAALASASLLLAACGGGDDGDGGGRRRRRRLRPSASPTSSIKIGTHMPLTGVGLARLQRDPDRAQGVLRLRQRRGRRQRPRDRVHGPGRHATTRPPPPRSPTSWSCRTRSSAWSAASARRPTAPSSTSSTRRRCRTCSSPPARSHWDDPEEYPYTFGWQPDYAVEGKIIGQYIAEEFPDAKVGLFLQGDDFGRDGAAGVKQFIEDQIVAEETYTPGNTDVGPQIAALCRPPAPTSCSASTCRPTPR